MSKKTTGKYILVIVESPGKISKIQKILGDDYLVMASYGHIIDLDKKNLSIDIDNGYEPNYKISDGKNDVIKKLKNAYYDCTKLLIASDEDREGEMIGWSIAYKLNVKNPQRIIFNSITQDALLAAVSNPGQIDYNMVDAQKVRRIFDRMIGYKISPLLWKVMGGGQYSAGRVQSVVVKRIIEQENKIVNFLLHDTSSYFKTVGIFSDSKNELKAQLCSAKSKTKKSKNKDDDINEDNDEDNIDEILSGNLTLTKITSFDEMKNIMDQLKESSFSVSDISERESIRQPSAPFTTSTLQQEASRKFGFGSKRTMMAAQHLYEGGHITYMRTDSTNLSDEALTLIGNHVKQTYGDSYHRTKKYEAKKKNTQEAHEAVRPTNPSTAGVSANTKHKISSDEIRLYSLIWKRAVASQMTPAKFKIITIEISISKLNNYKFTSQLESNIFPGFLVVYNLSNDKNEDDNEKNNDENDNDNSIEKIIIPKIGTNLIANNITSTQEYKKPPVRFNEASLVNELDPKNLNIGRPSTYSTIIDKIQSAGYVKKEDISGEEKPSSVLSWNGSKSSKIKSVDKVVVIGKEKNKFVPTSVGVLVNDFLTEYFPDIMEYKFTADMEDDLDEIALGKLQWVNVVDKFWKKFSPLVDELSNSIKPKEIMDKNARELGFHPDTGYKIIATIAKYGPLVKMVDCDKGSIVSSGPVKPPLKINKITLDEALKILEFPKTLGKYKNRNVVLTKGQYGYYLKYFSESIGLQITDDEANSFTIEDASAAITKKEDGEIWKGNDASAIYTVKNGPYGKYIQMKPTTSKSKKTANFKLLDDVDTSTLTIEKIHEIIKSSFENKKSRSTTTKSTTKSTTKKSDDEKPKKVKKSAAKKSDDEKPKKVKKGSTKK